MRTERDPPSEGNRRSRVEEALREAFSPELLEVEDESHRHRGHPGATSGGSHFRVLLVSARFEGLGRLERHRMVYDVLGGLMDTEIHALALRALTPAEQR